MLLKQSAAHENTKELSENLCDINFSNTENQEELTEKTVALVNCDTTTSLLSI